MCIRDSPKAVPRGSAKAGLFTQLAPGSLQRVFPFFQFARGYLNQFPAQRITVLAHKINFALFIQCGNAGPAVMMQDVYKRQVYRLDSRRHGESEKTKEISYDLLAQDTAAFIQALGLSRPALIGSSDGGITGLLLAIGWPGLLSCAVVCGANTHPRLSLIHI